MLVTAELLLLLSIIYQFCLCGATLNPFKIATDEIEIGIPKNYTLNSTVYYIIRVQNLSDITERTPPRIFVKCDKCNQNNPLLVVCNQNKEVMSWELPIVLKSDGSHSLYKNTERTICPYNIDYLSSSTSKPLIKKDHGFLDLNTYMLILTMFTSSKENVLAELVVKLEENFVLGLNENKTVQITPSTPAFYLYEFESDNITSVLLHVMSEDNTCLIVSVQNMSCPVFDLEENVEFQGHFQTVTRQGGLILTVIIIELEKACNSISSAHEVICKSIIQEEYKPDFDVDANGLINNEAFPGGFYVVLIVSTNDKHCNKMLVNSVFERTKNVVITLSKNISSNEFNVAIGITVLVIVLFCSTMFIIFICSMRRQKNEIPDLENEPIVNDELEASVSSQVPYNATSPVTPVTPVLGPVTPVTPVLGPVTPVTPVLGPVTPVTPVLGPVTPVTPVLNPVTTGDSLSIKTDSSLDETDFDLVNDAESDKNIYRMKHFLYVCDLSRKNQSILKKKSELYFWNVLTVSIFYFLPVFQLVFSDQYRFNQTGREDLCYYNFLCAHPLWWFSDFNHMFSNIGYISFGGLFIFLTGLKERDYKMKICTNSKLYKCYGIPQHFGIFYSMGAALITEGFLSLCYHICPNHYNFQFDSSFMYVISTLCMIKIYQSRHPDINASAYATFFLLAGVIVLGMYGVLSNNLTFWILFTIVHLSTCIYLSLQIYYIGRFKLEFINFVRWFKELQPCRSCHWKFFLPMFPSRFALLVITNLCNLGLAVGSFVYNIKNFSSYLLTIFMVNLVLYIAFYIFMKYICREKLSSQTIIYILLAMLCWSAALNFFFSKTTSWRVTPAESKLYNQKCKLLNFYDNHDIWHFISAAAMFFSFMVLLTLDDDLIYVHRSKIVVF